MGIDFLDISLVDAYTTSISVFTDVWKTSLPNGTSVFNCGNATCVMDISKCPPELRINNADGSFHSCISSCGAVTNATMVAKYPILAQVADRVLVCCGTRNTTLCGPDTWPASSLGTNYYQVFKSQCNTSYAYPDDDGASTYTCNKNPNYTITFCPENSTAASSRSMRGLSILLSLLFVLQLFVVRQN